ncbi:unnamed protein product [Diamesa hyperborea]
MKNTNGYTPMAKSPSNQGYMGYLTHKQLQQLNKYKKDQESDRDTVISGHTPLPHQMPSSLLVKKKSFDFTDYAYREAVGRLKMLLAESYVPHKYASSSSIFKSVTDDETDTDQQTVVERPAFKDVSKYFSYKPYSTHSTASSYIHKPMMMSQSLQVPMSSNIYSHTPSEALVPVGNSQPPSELLNFIEKQETYIEQLEKESDFCRDELSCLLTKVKDVISENETLTDKAKYGHEVSETDDVYDTIMRPTKFTATSGPNILFESRISELEAQLTQTNIDYKKVADENAELKRKRAFGSSESQGDQHCSDAYKKQIDNLQRDKLTLEDSVKKLHKQMNDLKENDSQVFSKTQRHRDLAEQAHFERTQADIEIRRLKDELERQHERVRECQHEMTKRVAEERSSADRRYTFQVDQLGGDLNSQWEQSSKLQLELERQKRIESDFKRELAQKSNQIDELRTEVKMKTTGHLSDLAQVNSEKQSLEQEITSLRMQLERCDRQGKVEASRLNAENSSLRQRMDRADADLLHSRRENLRLCDQISNLEKEIALGDISRDHKPVKNMETIISDMEDKHASTVQELEGMIMEQKQLMEKLTDQCKNLTHKLEDTSLKHKEEINSLYTNVEFLTNRINTSTANNNNNNNNNNPTNNNVIQHDDGNYSHNISQNNNNNNNNNINSSQPEHYVEDNANYTINDSPSSNINNVIKEPISQDADEQNNYTYNEPGSNSRSMSRTNSQQRFNTQSDLDNSNGGGNNSTEDWRQQRSISRNDSKKSLSENQQLQPDAIITSTIEESVIDETTEVRDPAFNQYEQQPQLQQVEQPGVSVYEQPQQQYQEPTVNEYDQGYGQQNYEQQQQNYEQQQEYDGTSNQPQYSTSNDYEQQPSQQDLGSTYNNTALNYDQSQEQYNSDNGQQQQQEQPQIPTSSPPNQSLSAAPSPVQKLSASKSPPSPTRAPKGVRGAKPEKAGEQKPGRGAVGEASGRKSQQGDLPKQPAKALPRGSIAPKK